jgi:hypothetical protein
MESKCRYKANHAGWHFESNRHQAGIPKGGHVGQSVETSRKLFQQPGIPHGIEHSRMNAGSHGIGRFQDTSMQFENVAIAFLNVSPSRLCIDLHEDKSVFTYNILMTFLSSWHGSVKGSSNPFFCDSQAHQRLIEPHLTSQSRSAVILRTMPLIFHPI